MFLSDRQFEALEFLLGRGKRRLIAQESHGRTYWFLEVSGGQGSGGQLDGRSARGLVKRRLVTEITDGLGPYEGRFKVTPRGRIFFDLEKCVRREAMGLGEEE